MKKITTIAIVFIAILLSSHACSNDKEYVDLNNTLTQEEKAEDGNYYLMVKQLMDGTNLMTGK